MFVRTDSFGLVRVSPRRGRRAATSRPRRLRRGETKKKNVCFGKRGKKMPSFFLSGIESTVQFFRVGPNAGSATRPASKPRVGCRSAFKDATRLTCHLFSRATTAGSFTCRFASTRARRGARPKRSPDVRPSPRRRARGRRPRLVQSPAGRAPGVRRAVPARPIQAVPQIAPSVGCRGRSAGVLRGVHRQSHEPHVQALLQGKSRVVRAAARRAASAS